MKIFQKAILVMLLTGFLHHTVFAQMITGAWKGKINRQKVELKIILNGDSLTGTSYYYESAGNYRRYSIKGYFDPETNSTVWWDDQLIEEKSGRFSIGTPGKMAMLSRADFNCPGGSKMMLDGKAGKKDNEGQPTGDVHLDKIADPVFHDEWDYVIDNYITGANDPDIIDSVERISEKQTAFEEPVNEKPVVFAAPPVVIQKTVIKEVSPVKEEKPLVIAPPVKAPTIEEKFTSRKKIFTKEIPVSGDSIELRFYDNAEIDGDSISLFLNDKLIFEHIRLAAAAYVVKLAVSDLKDTNELIMVAENLGAIPPNTSYMIALVGETRHEAYLASTEGSSALIRLVKQR